jgi:hypothetical protein
MEPLLDSDPVLLTEEPQAVSQVLEAIDHLLDAMENFEAPITRELLRGAMVALVHECRLPDLSAGALN